MGVLSSHCLQIGDLRLWREVSSGTRVSEFFQAAGWIRARVSGMRGLCQELPISLDLILAMVWAAWGGGLACLVGIQATFTSTLRAAGDANIAVGPAAGPRNASSTPGLEKHWK